MPTLYLALPSPERRIRLCARPRSPLQVIVVAPVPCPWVKHVNDVLQFGCKFRNGPQQHSLQRRDCTVVAVRLALLHDVAIGAIVRDPVDAQGGIELWTKTGREKAVAE